MLLNYTIQPQLLSRWCWSAVASSISMCLDPGSTWTQVAVGSTLLNTDCSEAETGNNALPFNEIQALEDSTKITGNYRQAAPPLELHEIILEIATNKAPIGCQISWSELGRSHFVCIFGYDDSTFELAIGDPESDGTGYLVSYESFKESYRSGKWIASILTKADK